MRGPLVAPIQKASSNAVASRLLATRFLGAERPMLGNGEVLLRRAGGIRRYIRRACPQNENNLLRAGRDGPGVLPSRSPPELPARRRLL